MSANPLDLAPSLLESYLQHKYLAWKECRLDLALVCTHRGEAEQQRALEAGASRAKFRESWHNLMPALAYDVAIVRKRLSSGRPAAFDWADEDGYRIVGEIGERLGLTWGGRFKSLKDLGHFQVLPETKPAPEFFHRSREELDETARKTLLRSKNAT